MAEYLLDTNILSDLVRNPQGSIADRIEIVGEAAIVTSVFVAAELRFGSAKKGASRLTEQVDAILSRMVVLPFEPPMDATYAEARLTLELKGRPIGANDLLIAAQAKTLGLCVVTANIREFARIPGLRIENWLAES